MKTNKSLLLVTAFAAITSLGAFAAENDNRPERPERPARPERPERPGRGGDRIEIPRFEVPENLRNQLPQALQDQIARYREQARTFIDSQRELRQTLRGATEEERTRIREQLRTNRERFLADTQQLRNEIRDQLREIRHNHREQQGGTNPGRGGRGERPRG